MGKNVARVQKQLVMTVMTWMVFLRHAAKMVKYWPCPGRLSKQDEDRQPCKVVPPR